MTKKITLLTLLLTFMSFITLEMKGAEEAIAVAETAVEETAEEAPAFTTVEEFQSMPVAYPKFMVDNLWILLSAALVFIMHLGFATLESGLTRQKNTVNILFKNVFIISMGVLSYAMWGFISMYPGDAWTITGFLAMGSPIPNGFAEGADSVANLTNQYADYTYWSDFIFQAMFAATAATIVSGAVAERIKLGSFMIGATVLVMIGYPITGSWHWGGGWLSEMGFADFAGSTLVHAFGGFAALAAVLLLGARRGKYVNGQIKPILGHSMPLATIGVFMLFLGWFGFNGGSVLSADPAGVSLVFVTTAMAGCAGGLAAALFSWIFLKKPDLSMALNGLLAGLVGITAGADVIPPWAAVITGAIAGVLVVLSVLFFDKIKIDDPVGAISVHGVCGIWGTLAVGIFGGANFVTQLIGTAAISAFAFAFTFIVFGIIKAILGLRVTEEEEEEGLDVGEHGISGYPNFQPAVDH
ncbi:MAG: ammonium transporter [Verrucomicrobiae bacterium]|nr:ammonium transporter [Verrucomicrobiae bacterium]